MYNYKLLSVIFVEMHKLQTLLYIGFRILINCLSLCASSTGEQKKKQEHFLLVILSRYIFIDYPRQLKLVVREERKTNEIKGCVSGWQDQRAGA